MWDLKINLDLFKGTHLPEIIDLCFISPSKEAALLSWFFPDSFLLQALNLILIWFRVCQYIWIWSYSLNSVNTPSFILCSFNYSQFHSPHSANGYSFILPVQRLQGIKISFKVTSYAPAAVSGGQASPPILEEGGRGTPMSYWHTGGGDLHM